MKKNVRGIAFLNFKNYYKITVIKSGRHWWKQRQIYRQSASDREINEIQWEKNSLQINNTGYLDMHMQQIGNEEIILTWYIKINWNESGINKWSFSPRRYTNYQWIHETMFNILSHQLNTDENHNEILFYTY